MKEFLTASVYLLGIFGLPKALFCLFSGRSVYRLRKRPKHEFFKIRNRNAEKVNRKRLGLPCNTLQMRLETE